MMEDEFHIDNFLEKLKLKLDFYGFRFSRERIENRETMKELSLSRLSLKGILSELTLENYSEGPIIDEEEGDNYYVFGIEIDNREIYIKLNSGKENEQVICHSFHFAKFRMKYPKKIIK